MTMSNTTEFPIGNADEHKLVKTMKRIVDFINYPLLKEEVIE